MRQLLMPVEKYPDGTYHTDSSPIIEDLERRHTPRRSVVPQLAGHAFLSFLLEDCADEWLTKSLSNYRFSTPGDQSFSGRWAMDDARADLSAIPARWRSFAARRRARNIGSSVSMTLRKSRACEKARRALSLGYWSSSARTTCRFSWPTPPPMSGVTWKLASRSTARRAANRCTATRPSATVVCARPSPPSMTARAATAATFYHVGGCLRYLG